MLTTATLLNNTFKNNIMNKILNTIEKTSLGKGFLLTTGLFVLVAIICFFFLLLIGLWNDNVLELFTELFAKIINAKGKLAAFYLGCCILLGLSL